jgi:transposase InsO family protein
VNIHKNARLTPVGRSLVVHRIARRESITEVAREMGVSLRTVRKWVQRYRAAGEAGLTDRSSRPHRSPTALRRTPRRQIARLRRKRHSSLYIARHLQLPLSTVVRVQRRLGLNRLDRLEAPPPVVRYERARPGELLHLDVKKLGRIRRWGHRVTGTRRWQHLTRGAGWEFLHVALDDHSRLTYAELLPDERGETAAAFLTRAAAWFHARGVSRIDGVMTDNGAAYLSRAMQAALGALGARHLRTRPYTPRTNGKVERVIQTLLREWAYARPYRTSLRRSVALQHYLVYYNTQRPHTALNFLPPAHRLISGTTS